MRRGRLRDALAAGEGVLDAAQAALTGARERWRDDPRAAPLLAALAYYGTGGPLGSFDHAAAAAAFVDHLVPALAAQPLGQVPFRHGYAEGVSSLLLAREGRALLSLVAREPGRFERRVAGFDGSERRESVLAGKGSGRLVRRVEGVLRFEPCALEPGTTLQLAPGDEVLLVDAVEIRLVSLRIDRLPERAPPVREYALDSGALLHQSAGDPQDSRVELALAILGRMRRGDAAPLMARIAGDTAGAGDNLRWQALRECIALDTAAGLIVLRSIANDLADPLRAPALALLGQLSAAHPELAALEPA